MTHFDMQSPTAPIPGLVMHKKYANWSNPIYQVYFRPQGRGPKEAWTVEFRKDSLQQILSQATQKMKWDSVIELYPELCGALEWGSDSDTEAAGGAVEAEEKSQEQATARALRRAVRTTSASMDHSTDMRCVDKSRDHLEYLQKAECTNHVEAGSFDCRNMFSLIAWEARGEGAKTNTLQLQLTIMFLYGRDPEAKFPLRGESMRCLLFPVCYES